MPSFAPEIACELYRDGYDREAWEVMKRLLWLGKHYPYVGDSHCADRADYRRDTPLQCNIEGTVFAQAIIFGVCGVQVRSDFSIEVKPHLPADTDRLELRNVRLAGQVFDLACSRASGTEVRVNGTVLKADASCPILIPAVVNGTD